MGDERRPLTVKVTAATEARIDRLAERMSRAAGGVQVTRHAALVAIVERGLDVLEREVGGAEDKRRKR